MALVHRSTNILAQSDISGFHFHFQYVSAQYCFYRNCENITIDVSDGINPECDDNQANSYKYSRDAFKQCGNIKQDNLILVYIHFYKINQRIGCVFY